MASSSMVPALSSPLYKPLQKSPIILFLSSFKTPISLQLNLKSHNPISEFQYKNNITLTTISSFKASATPATISNFAVTAPSLDETKGQRHWIVVIKVNVVKAPPSQQAVSRPDVIDYYVQILDKVLGSEKDAQGCIYNASFGTQFGFCCDIDEETSKQLACLPEVISIKPDPDFDSVKKNNSDNVFPPLFPAASSKNWLVRVEMPEPRITTRAQLVDYYTQTLTNVLGNENDAQMCIYHVSLQSDYGFCCELDDDCAKELAGVPGVISVRPDENADSENKDYGGQRSSGDSSIANQPANIKTKKLFVTGLSFYTSEKTLRAAFEGFGELVEVKIIMDKISKRSKGFAFIEYTTEEAASEALREMNGKIINGWMIVVDVAKTNPPKYNRERPRSAS